MEEDGLFSLENRPFPTDTLCMRLFLLLCILLGSAPFSALAAPELLARQEAELRRTKNFLAQGKRVDEFSCASDLRDLHKIYAKQRRHFLESENILDSEKRGQTSFRSLPGSERQKLAPLFPAELGLFVKQMSLPEIAGPRMSLILATMMRETDFQLFLDEEEPGDMLKGKGTRAGAGLMQMTAWNKEYVKKWGPHDFDKYGSERSRELWPNIRDFFLPGASPMRSRWLPKTLDLETAKDDLRTAEQFVRSPYNPAVAFWYGRVAMSDAERKVAELGIRDLDNANRAAILGVFYNAGIERVKCLRERQKIWNLAFPAETLEANDWDALRPFLYLHPDFMEKAGFPPELSARLERACDGKSGCSCLDQEPPSPRAALKGNDFKAAVSASYGDHMRKLQECFAGFVEQNQ
jgi:hypothetical protein